MAREQPSREELSTRSFSRTDAAVARGRYQFKLARAWTCERGGGGSAGWFVKAKNALSTKATMDQCAAIDCQRACVVGSPAGPSRWLLESSSLSPAPKRELNDGVGIKMRKQTMGKGKGNI